MAYTDKIQIDSTAKDIIAPEVLVSQTAETATIQSNCFNLWSTAVTALTLTLGTDNNLSGKENEYHFRFTVSGSSFALTFSGSTVTFQSTPTWTDGNTYEISIVDDYALVAEFS